MGNLSPIVSEFANTDDEQAYQRWFHQKVTTSLRQELPAIQHANVMAELDEIIDRAETSSPAP